MTKNLKLFALFSIGWSIIFFSVLNWGIVNPNHRWPVMWVGAFVYGIGFSILGKYLGKREKGAIRHNIRAAYVATSTGISGIIGALWVALFHPDQWWQIIAFAVIAGGFTWHVFVKYRNSVKGMKGEELFK